MDVDYVSVHDKAPWYWKGRNLSGEKHLLANNFHFAWNSDELIGKKKKMGQKESHP